MILQCSKKWNLSYLENSASDVNAVPMLWRHIDKDKAYSHAKGGGKTDIWENLQTSWLLRPSSWWTFSLYVRDEEDEGGEVSSLEESSCSIYGHRPLVCRFYPFELKPEGNGQHTFSVTHECPGMGEAESLERILRSIVEAGSPILGWPRRARLELLKHIFLFYNISAIVALQKQWFFAIYIEFSLHGFTAITYARWVGALDDVINDLRQLHLIFFTTL